MPNVEEEKKGSLNARGEGGICRLGKLPCKRAGEGHWLVPASLTPLEDLEGVDYCYNRIEYFLLCSHLVHKKTDT